jgi:predicted MFS family arabinose efflux permease
VSGRVSDAPLAGGAGGDANSMALASVSARRADALALTLMSFLALNAVSLSLVPIVAPQLQDSFALSASQIGLLTSAYSLAVSLVAIPAGLAAQRWGGRIMLLAVAVFAIGSLLFAVASSFEYFMVARFLQGVGAGAGVPVGTTLIAHAITPSRRSRALGFFGAGMGAGMIGSLLILPSIQRSGGFRAVFLAAAGLSVLVAAGAVWQRAVRAVPDRDDGAPPLRAAGGALSAAVRNPGVLLIAVMNLAGLAVVVGLLTWTPGLLHDHSGSSLAMAAYLTAGVGIATLVGNPLGALAQSKWGKAPTLAVTLGMSCVMTALIPVVPGLTATFVVVAVDGFFAAAMLPPLLGSIPDVVARPDQVGAASGLMALLTFGGSLLAPWFFGALLDSHGRAAGQSGYLDGYLMLAGLALAGALAAGAFWLMRRRGPGTPQMPVTLPADQG